MEILQIAYLQCYVFSIITLSSNAIFSFDYPAWIPVDRCVLTFFKCFKPPCRRSASWLIEYVLVSAGSQFSFMVISIFMPFAIENCTDIFIVFVHIYVYIDPSLVNKTVLLTGYYVVIQYCSEQYLQCTG